MDHALRLLASEFLRILQALLGRSSPYAVDNDKLVKRTAVKQLQFNAPVSSRGCVRLCVELIRHCM